MTNDQLDAAVARADAGVAAVAAALADRPPASAPLVARHANRLAGWHARADAWAAGLQQPAPSAPD